MYNWIKSMEFLILPLPKFPSVANIMLKTNKDGRITF